MCLLKSPGPQPGQKDLPEVCCRWLHSLSPGRSFPVSQGTLAASSSSSWLLLVLQVGPEASGQRLLFPSAGSFPD